MPRVRKESPAIPPTSPLVGLPVDPVATGSARRWLVQFLLPLAIGGVLVGGVFWLGRDLGSRLHDGGEYTIAFADIECEAPPGMTRTEFLEDAQYLAGLPDRLSTLAPTTHQQLFDALALHPWVARVRRLEWPSAEAVRADLLFRRPTLAVPPDRVVDGEGILLPRQATAQGLPRLRSKVRPPIPRAGQLWDDPTVIAASRVASLLRDELARRQVECEIEVLPASILIDLGKTRILWGRPPGQEVAGEAPAAVKVQRLREAGDLDANQWDLRPEAGIARTSRE